MTRDGAVSVNLVTGETTYPSDREPEGVPRITERMDGRALRLKALGNAVCPPQAYPIFHYIAAIETGACAGICPYGKAGDDG